jgi:hypothetical protein
MASKVGFAQGGERIGRLARLGYDHHRGVHQRLHRPIAVLAGVLHVDGNAAEVFDNQLGEQTCMAAGAACRDDKLVLNTGQPIELDAQVSARNPSPFTQ